MFEAEDQKYLMLDILQKHDQIPPTRHCQNESRDTRENSTFFYNFPSTPLKHNSYVKQKARGNDHRTIKSEGYAFLITKW